jgi:hypothetical protein
MNVYNNRAMLKRRMRKYRAMNVHRRNVDNFHGPLTDGVDRSDPRSGCLHLQASTPDLRVLITRSHGEARTWLEEIISYACGNVGHTVA